MLRVGEAQAPLGLWSALRFKGIVKRSGLIIGRVVKSPPPKTGEKFNVKPLQPLVISGREVLPLVEGGQGIAVSNGESCGASAAAGGVGTSCGVNVDFYDEHGKLIPVAYH